MKCLIIPDCHLKPKMFDQANELLEKGVAECAVVLGDLVDDWGEEFNVSLYEDTMEKAIWFHEKHPETLWCIGNHDVGYYSPQLGVRESGHSRFQETIMNECIKKFEEIGIKQNIINKVDNVLFSHAGVNKDWVKRHIKRGQTFDKFIDWINSGPGEGFKYIYLWEDDSPIWWRPQTEYGGEPKEAYGNFMQVVGHSPMKYIRKEGNILSCDTFSTYKNGCPYGDQCFAVVDSESKAWAVVEYEYDK